jgi:hypothetical protein
VSEKKKRTRKEKLSQDKLKAKNIFCFRKNKLIEKEEENFSIFSFSLLF